MVYRRRTVSDTGEIVEADPPRRLVIRWRHRTSPNWRPKAIAVHDGTGAYRNGGQALDHPHIERDPSKLIAAVSGGWPKILSNLKSLLENGFSDNE